MADFTNGFWDIYIVVLTLLGIVGCGILLFSQAKVKLAKGKDGKVGTTGHTWDEDLTELNTPMPRWWMWLFYLTIVFGGAYLFQLGEPDACPAQGREAPFRFARIDLLARGNKGFPNLTDNDWLFGGAPETIKESILRGRMGVMPPMGAALGSDKDVENVAHYVLSLSGSTADPIKAVFGKGKFGACMACHSAGGTGNQTLGAPNLSDKVWLFGGSAETIMETIRKGRNATMPAFEDFLGDAKVHVLAAYIWSLSNDVSQPLPAPAAPAEPAK